MAAIGNDDVSISATGAIRWEGAATTPRHTVLEFIQFLMDKQDDEQAAGDDLLDITVDTPFVRSTDQILSLNSPFNIDDTFATHLYDGSVSQTEPTLGGETLYSGLNIIGPVASGTEYMIIQNGKVLSPFWATGINPEAAPSLVFSRHLIRSKFAGSQVDGQRILVLARDYLAQYRRFPVTLGTGNSVAAISNGLDIFNTTADATIAGFTDILNTEGFQELDIDRTGAAGQEYYSQWVKDSRTVNQVYERTKWISQRGHQADVTTGAATGTDFPVSDGTNIGAAQSFIPLTGGEHLVEARFMISKTLLPGGNLYAELLDSNDASPAIPTGAVLARSEEVLGSSITTSIEEVIFRFNIYNPASGVSQAAGLALDNVEYFIALRTTTAGDASNHFDADGAASDVDGTQDSAVENGGWVGSVNDIYCEVKSSPEIHTLPGEQMQGINIEVGYDGEGAGGVAENDIVMWGTKIDYDGLTGGPFFPGEEIVIVADAVEDAGQPLKTGGHVLFDEGTDQLVLALDSPSAGVINDNDEITGLISGAFCAINVAGGAIEDEDLGGGTGIVLAQDDNTGTGEIYIQVLTGVNPVEDIVIRTSDLVGAPITDFVVATSVLVTKTIVPEYLGTSTGSNIIGAYGIGFDIDDVGPSDRFTDLADGTRTPPNNVQFTVSGLVSGEDRVLVGPRTGTALDRGQWVLDTTLAALNETVVVCDTGTDTIPFPDNEENWPDAGNALLVSRLRVYRDDGASKRLAYSSHDGIDTFTLDLPVTGAIDIDVQQVGGTGGELLRVSAGSFITDGFENGQRITLAAFATSNGDYTIDSVTATIIVVVDDTGMTNESGSGDETITGIGYDFTEAVDGVGPSGWSSDGAIATNDVFMAFIDVLASGTTAAFTGVHVVANDRDLFVRVRDGGGTPIKTFESPTAQFLATAQTIAATRTDDF